ncbi:cellulase family glycosylhydrolase [Tautonia plasticadhaerens]|uniref:Cellulase (Glycosyl hydrolase family 5) n=1 Tax=Tautonia plasticadhaerens TaxID=2527974 RepID=A0A518HD25_9BACT|nr:cellulase family glycosylhydrolase [Tautonia plasticadhaerens]QDV38761.1 Cellulase (glycosyl hydrolase family 5) [Tautonia plasticadhaerens]
MDSITSRLISVAVALLPLLAPEGVGQEAAPGVLDLIEPSPDRSHFVSATTGERVVMWGFNYDHDDSGRLLEDYWADEWDAVAGDFREMRDLGANVVRIHLQLGKFMTSPDEPDPENLRRLGDLVRLAEEVGLYLDLTGLGCYHAQDVPDWYDELGESDRWDVQARFWEAVAGVCAGSPALFCYDLMNEPVLDGGQGDGWLVGEPLGGKYFVQRITRDRAGRPGPEVAAAWIRRLTDAIREVDDRTMITVGVIPWAHTFTGAKPLFHGPEAGGPLDFVGVHFYPKEDDIEGSMDALRVYEVGKPLVVEEIFPLNAGLDGTLEFMDGTDDVVDGWISFYWGKTIEECEQAGDLKGAIVAAWLKAFRDRSPYVAAPPAGP